MKHVAVIFMAGILAAGPAGAQSMADEKFTDEDFAQFFGLIENGKITREKMNARCENEVVGFTFAGKDLVHEGGLQRVDYNVTGMTASVDGRVLRSRHYNATFGEWTGAVFKPLCPGMWAISVDFATADLPGRKDGLRLHLYVRRADEDRPGMSVLQTAAVGGGSSGHLSIALPLRTGDEVSTWTEGIGAKSRRALEGVTFTAYKVGHLGKYIEEFDVDAWNADLLALK